MSGIALLTAALNTLSLKQAKVLLTTHFLEIFSCGLAEDGHEGVKALQMAVQIPESSQDVPVPLFRLQDGVAQSSAAIACASMAGVKTSILHRAQEILDCKGEGQKFPLVPELVRGTGSASSYLAEYFMSMDWQQASAEELKAFLVELSNQTEFASDEARACLNHLSTALSDQSHASN